MPILPLVLLGCLLHQSLPVLLLAPRLMQAVLHHKVILINYPESDYKYMNLVHRLDLLI